MSRFLFWRDSPFERKSLPIHGMSERTGTLSLTVRTSSRVKPPMTTVAPSNTVTVVLTSLMENTGWMKPEGTVTVVPEEIATATPPYSMKPSNSVTFGLRTRLMLSSSSTFGVTSMVTPTSTEVKS